MARSLLITMLASQIQMSGFQFPSKADLGRQQVIAQTLVSLAPTLKDLDWVSSFWPQLSSAPLLRPLWEWTDEAFLSFSVSVSVFASELDTNVKTDSTLPSHPAEEWSSFSFFPRWSHITHWETHYLAISHCDHCTTSLHGLLTFTGLPFRLSCTSLSEHLPLVTVTSNVLIRH